MPDPALLAAKVAAAVLVVVLASRASERGGPFLGAMVATLPVSTGPVYVFLALDHGAAFIAQAAVASVAAVGGIVAFVAAHAIAAQKLRTAASLAIGTAAWFAAAGLLALRDWQFLEACAIAFGALAAAIAALRRHARAPSAPSAPRPRYDLALRAALVATVVVATKLASDALGPSATGILATYPVVFTCLVAILQPRFGGRFTAAVLVQGLKGLLGFALALAALHLAAAQMSAAPALVLALAVAIAWNVALTLGRRYT